ncbi:MAG: BLUF domain-containing protein [Pseudomonadota bacterium]
MNAKTPRSNSDNHLQTPQSVDGSLPADHPVVAKPAEDWRSDPGSATVLESRAAPNETSDGTFRVQPVSGRLPRETSTRRLPGDEGVASPSDGRSMLRVLYQSKANFDCSPKNFANVLNALVHKAHRDNTKNGITGALACHSGVIVQAIEGPREPVETLFEKICCDLRHTEMELIDVVEVRERLFVERGMALVTAKNAGSSISARAQVDKFIRNAAHCPDETAKTLHDLLRL